MSTTSAAPEATPPAAPAQAGRRLETDIEPLTIPDELRASSLVDLVHRTVQRFPNKEALRWKLPRTRRQMGGGEPEADEEAVWRSITYREMWDWIAQVAMGLKHLGIRDGDAVCIMSRTRPAWLTADIGAMSLGAVTCPIYPSSEPNQAAFVINNVAAKAIFVENLQQYAKIEKVRAQCPTLEQVIVIEDRGRLPEGAVSFDDIFDLADCEPGELRDWEEAWREFGRDKVATIVHTSGTTAEPKGVVLTHGNILHNFEAGIQAVDFDENDLFLSFLPLSHMTERAAGQVVPLGRGCTIAYAEPAIERLAANMVEVRPTVMVAVPRLYERLYARVMSTVEASPPLRQKIFDWAQGLGRQHYQNHLDGKPDSLWLRVQKALADRLVFNKIKARTGGRVRYFVSGGAPLSREVGEFFYAMGMLILEGYGLTETAPLLSINRPHDFKFGTVGRPVAETQVRIDPETGEILARGPQIMKGYHNQPEETRRVIEPDGWFHTGDIGELDEIGRIIITDRLKNIIVLANGKNVAPAPLEIAMLTSKYIAQAIVLGDQQPYTGALIAPDFEEVGKWAAANGIAEMPPEQLIEERAVQKLIESEVRARLEGFANYERPRRVALLPRLLTEEEGELTPSLKVKLRVVKEKWADRVAYLFDEQGKE
ncbi:MAG TPA: long-chain fatty acid--CoA ligase [candidate division Zixibacteria bacterium]|nr:long-chain fatty acid--CoA ligase [candidate division Zixibacteria bacterium]